MKTLAVAAVLFAGCATTHGFDLVGCGKADVVAVATVSNDTPTRVGLTTKTFDGKVVGGTVCGIYHLTNVIALKGDVAQDIQVLGEPPPAANQSGRIPVCPPAGKRLIVLLQAARDGRFLEDVTSNLPPEESQYADAPTGIRYRFLDYLGTTPWTVLESVPAALPIHHDYLAYDLARVLAVAGPSATALGGRDSVRPYPDAADCKMYPEYPGGTPDIEAAKAYFGPDPAAFYKSEIEPVLKPPADDAERMDRLELAGAWGVPKVSSQIADLILAQGSMTGKLLKSALYAASSVAHFYDGTDAMKRLLASKDPRVQAAVAGVLQSASRKDLAPDMFKLLDSSDEDVLRGAMRALSAMFLDRAHSPKTGRSGGFEPGSFNASLLDYWRAKRPH